MCCRVYSPHIPQILPTSILCPQPSPQSVVSIIPTTTFQNPADNNNSMMQVEAIVQFRLTTDLSTTTTAGREQPYNVGISLLTGRSGEASIRATGTWVPADANGNQARIMSAAVYVDTRNAGGATQPTLQGGGVVLPPDGIPVEELELRVFIDHSIMETYALRGRTCITTRIYPLTQATDGWGLGVFSVHTVGTVVNSTVWSLGSGTNSTLLTTTVAQ